jgi:uncharacterized OB-fold protein
MTSTQHVRWDLEYDIHLGATWGRFMEGLKDRKILGNTSSRSNKVYVPPQAYCEETFETNDEWLEIGQEGDLEVFTIVHHGFRGGPETPYAIGAIRLDGADTLLMHVLKGVPLDSPANLRSALPNGKRVRAVWADERVGHILDISHFEPAV